MPIGSKSNTLDVIIRVRDAASKNLQKVDRRFQGLQTRLASLPKTIFNVKTAITGLAGGVGIGLLTKSFIQAASAAEQYRIRLNVLLGSTKEGNRLFKEMADYASSVSFQYEEIMGAATSLAGVMRGGTDEVKKWMPLIGDLAAATGLSIQETTGQIIRMYSAGAASADMFRERGVLAMLGFQAGVHYSAEETRKRLIEAWEDPASQFRGTAVDLAKTWSGLMSMFADKWFQFRNMVMEGGVFDLLKAQASALLDHFERLKKEGRLDVYAEKVAKTILAVINVMTKTIVRGGAIVSEILLFLRRDFEGIKFVLNAILAGWADLVSLILKGASDISKALHIKGLQEGLGEAADQFHYVAQTAREEMDKSAENLIKLADRQGEYWKASSQFFEDMRQKAREFAEAQEKEGKAGKPKPPVDLKQLEAEQKSYIARLSETTKTALLILENNYKKGKVALENYFKERQSLISKEYEAEIALAEKMAKQETDPAKRIALQDKVFQLRQRFERDLLALEQERIERAEELEEKELARRRMLESLKLRIATDFAGNLQAQFQAELAEMDWKHEEEIKRLQELYAKKEELDEAYRLQKLEKDRLLVDQERRLHEYRLQLASDVASGMANIFDNLYALAGKKHKEFFYLAKAAALAEAIVNTAQAITKALAQGGIMGPAMAAIVAAQGAIQIATITAQHLAAGGKIQGNSPSDTADNVPIFATAGEYVQPVKTVRHYGLQVMEALRKRLIPKELFAGLTLPNFPMQRPAYAFAGGGQIPVQTPGIEQKSNINIINIVDPKELDRYLASSTGQDAILNVISSRAEAVRRLLR